MHPIPFGLVEMVVVMASCHLKIPETETAPLFAWFCFLRSQKNIEGAQLFKSMPMPIVGLCHWVCGGSKLKG